MRQVYWRMRQWKSKNFIKQRFLRLAEDVHLPFNKAQREELYAWYQTDIQTISKAVYHKADAKKIQTRIKTKGATCQHYFMKMFRARSTTTPGTSYLLRRLCLC